MGYTTEFSGHIQVEPPLTEHEAAYLTKFATTRRMQRTNGPYYVQGTGFMGQGSDPDVTEFNRPPAGQPGLWCQWIPSEDRTKIIWDGGEKFYASEEWMRYIIEHFLKSGAAAKTQTSDGQLFFTFGDHVLNGVIEAQGEDSEDHWFLAVRNNQVETVTALPTSMKLLPAA